MEGQQETIRAAKAESEKIESMINQWMEYKEKSSFVQQSDLTSIICQKLYNTKGLISVLKYLGTKESIEVALILEAHLLHFQDLLQFSKDSSTNIENNQDSDGMDFLKSLIQTTKEIDHILHEESNILVSMQNRAERNETGVKNITLRVREAGRECNVIVLLILVIVILFAYVLFKYKQNIK